MHANKMRLNKLNDSVLTVNYTVERRKKTHTQKKRCKEGKQDGNSGLNKKQNEKEKKREANEYDLICWIYALYPIQPSETNRLNKERNEMKLKIGRSTANCSRVCMCDRNYELQSLNKT